MRVRAMMQRHIVTLGPDDNLREAWDLMQEGGFRHIPVIDGEDLVGIISDRDVMLRATYDEGAITIPNLILEEVMTREVTTCSAGTQLGDVADIMIDQRIDALPVTDSGGRLTGIITSTDLMSLIAVRDHDLSQRPLPFSYQIERRGAASRLEMPA